MIANDTELKVTLERIARFQEQVAHLRRMETNPENYHGAVSGFLAEIDRMQLDFTLPDMTQAILRGYHAD